MLTNVSFISGTLLKSKFRRKLMLKYDIKNFLEQFMKNLLWKNITHEQTFSSQMPLPILQFLQIKQFVLLDKACKLYIVIYNLLKIVLVYCNFEFRWVFSFFSAFEPKVVKFSVKLNITCMVISFIFHDLWQLWLVAYKSH